LAIDPGFASARLAVGEALLRLGRGEEARWELAKLCELTPDRADAHAAHALVLARLGRIAAAEQAAERALALDSELPAAHRARAEILKRRGDYRAAIAELERVLRAHPGSVEDRLALATVRIAAGEVSVAERELEALEQAAPRRAEVCFARAFAALRLERHREAAAAARRALGMRENYPEARLVLAEALLRTGELRDGRDQLARFMKEAPPGMEAERQLAESYLRGEATEP
jgi:predicted Zn-dependent protease